MMPQCGIIILCAHRNSIVVVVALDFIFDLVRFPVKMLTCVCFSSPQCIVIGLQSTGESRTREVLDENDGHLDRFVSAAE